MSRPLDIRLCHVVPPLAHTCDDTAHRALAHPRITEERWWRRVRLPLVTGRIGAESVAIGLARLALERWEGHALGEVMPALYAAGERPSVLATPVWRLREPVGAEAAHEYLRDLFLTVLDRLPREAVDRETDGTTAARVERAPTTMPRRTDVPEQDRPSPERPTRSYVHELETHLSSDDERRRAVAVRRVFSRTPETLDSLGESFGVTRERIRQIHKQIREDLRARLEGPEGAFTAAHLRSLTTALGTATPLKAFWNLDPGHRHLIPSLGLPVGEILLALLPEHRVAGDWIVTGASASLAERFSEELSRRIVLPLHEATALLLDGGVPSEHTGAWLETLPRTRIMDGHLVLWGRNLPDKAFAVLSLAGRPLHFDELVERVGGDFNESGFRERVHGDERIVRRDRRLFGLRSWGGREYLGLEETIRRELERAGGEMAVSDLVERITGWFDVTENSIRAMASGSAFARPAPGRVALPGTVPDHATAPYRPKRTVERTRRCFRCPDGVWWLRVDLNGEHLRGSGFPIPSGFAAWIGMRPGHRLPVRIGDRDSVAAWKNQPLMNSIRPLLLAEEARVGDHAFITLAEGRLLCRVHRHDPAPADPLAHALSLAGLPDPVSGTEGLTLLTRAVGLPEATAPDHLLAHLADRGDHDLLAALTPTD